MAALASNLDQRQIRYVFVYTSYMKPTGEFTPTYGHAARFVSGLKIANPDLHIQAWIGLPLEYVNLSDAAVRERIVQFCINLVREAGFDGIHLDPEPIPTDEENVLVLLDELRDALGSEPTLSMATRRIWPIFPDRRWPLIGQVAWRASYYREVSQRVNQIVVMTYDSAMPLASLYRQWVRFQVIEVSRAVEGTGVQLFFGIPTSEERTWTHWPCAENMESGLEGVIDGLNDAKARPAAITGVAIYPYWETDETEWRIYEELWLGRLVSDE
ncbi:MAG: glycosyl hydrolase family 18 protein [Anaerolineae bacterium]